MILVFLIQNKNHFDADVGLSVGLGVMEYLQQKNKTLIGLQDGYDKARRVYVFAKVRVLTNLDPQLKFVRTLLLVVRLSLFV